MREKRNFVSSRITKRELCVTVILETLGKGARQSRPMSAARRQLLRLQMAALITLTVPLLLHDHNSTILLFPSYHEHIMTCI